MNARGGDAQATPVLWASKKCNLSVVNLLLQHGADPLVADDQGYNLLHCATLDGNVFQLILLLHHGDIDVDVPDTQGHTSLMWAAYKGFPACVDILLRWGADVHRRDSQGFTALHWALVKGSYGCIQKMIEYGADRFAANNEGKTPAVTAQEMNSVRMWHRALDDSGYDENAHPKEFPLGFVKDTRKFLSRFFFLWPSFVLGVTFYILAHMPVLFGLPLSMVVSYCLQWLGLRLLKWAPMDMKHVHKTVSTNLPLLPNPVLMSSCSLFLLEYSSPRCFGLVCGTYYTSCLVSYVSLIYDAAVLLMPSIQRPTSPTPFSTYSLLRATHSRRIFTLLLCLPIRATYPNPAHEDNKK